MEVALSPELARIPGTDSVFDIARMTSDTISFLVSQHERFGRVSRARIVTPNVYLFGPEANRVVMVSRRHDFSYRLGYGRLAFARLFENSVLLQDGEEHARTRAVLEPAVGPVAIAQCLPLVQGVWDRWLARSNDTRSHDVYELALAATYEAAGAALVGFDRTSELEPLRPLFQTLIEGSNAWVPVRIPGANLDRGLRARAKLVAALLPRVAEARRRPAKGMLGLLAHHHDERGRELPDDEVVAHTLLLFWAGYDTTASAGSWSLHMLAEHAAVQEELREEAFRVLGDRPYAQEDQARLVKMGWFLREIERHCPSILIFARETLADVEVEGHTIPKGTPITWSPYLTHRMPELYENPNAFDPSRWDPARGDKVAKATYLVGFGGGPRICLGRNFALMQLRVMLASVLRRYRVEPGPTSRWRTVMLPMHHPSGYRVRLVRL